jgi:pimeloyl-ACP methyl ester carboxylesterase
LAGTVLPRKTSVVTKIPLLLLPGLLCDARLWRDQVADLSAVADPFVADLTLDDSFEAMARRALARMPERFALAALSMGGYVAFAVLRSAPERVIRLALLDTSARPDTEFQARRRRGLMALARGGHFRGVTPRLLPQLLHPDNLADPELTGEIMAMAERVGRQAFIRQQAAILNRPDSRPDLRRIAVPTLVAVGVADQLTPRDRAEEIAAGIPGAMLRVIEGCGHLPPMERPALTSALLREWLDPPAAAERMRDGA